MLTFAIIFKENWMQKKTVCHQGTIKSIFSDRLEISIISQSACVSCQVKGACSVSDTEEKVIDVDRVKGATYRIGDQVTVVMDQSGATKAVLLGYGLPFLVLLFVLVVATMLSGSEGLAGLLAIGSLAPYYLLLWLLRKRIKKSFQFRIQTN